MNMISAAGGVYRLAVYNRIPTGPAFAHVDGLGGDAYIPRSTAIALDLQPGDCVLATVVHNTARPDKTPWFAPHVTRDEAQPGRVSDVATVQHLLFDIGGVWTLPELASRIGGLNDNMHETDDPALLCRANAAAETLYQRGGVSKFARFDAPGGPAVQVWYTTDPESADVDEWVEEDGE